MNSSPDAFDRLDLPPQALKALLPGVGSAGLNQVEAARQQPRGRILKLRLGMNPNSSSVGTNVVVFMWSLLACSAVFTVAGSLLFASFAQPSKDDGEGH